MGCRTACTWEAHSTLRWVVTGIPMLLTTTVPDPCDEADIASATALDRTTDSLVMVATVPPLTAVV
jgi:hypothetical protein